MINIQAIRHIPNSKMAYPIDEETLFISLEVAKNDIDKVEMIIGDPHDYIPDDNMVYHWVIKINPRIEMQKCYSNELYDYFICKPTLKYGRAKYSFVLYKGNDIYYYGSKVIRKIEKDDQTIYDNYEYFCFPYINEEDIIKPIPWINNTIWYQIFPERFSHHNDGKKYLPWGSVEKGITNNMFFGGNLLGIIDKIPYLKELGINGIYFTPIFESPSTHKYDTTDYFKIDPQFGTNDDFKLLVDTCHKYDIKVMLDAVFNHCGWSHPFFQDVVKNGKNSKYYDCFYYLDENFINFDIVNNVPAIKKRIIPNFRTFAFTPFMPKMNTSNPIMQNYLLEVTKYWITNYDIDGYRLDVSNEVSHTFWRKFRALCDSLKKDFYVLGENWEDSNPWLGNDQLNAVMNYEFSYPIWMFFGERKYDAKKFVYSINDVILKYPQNASKNMFNLISSHDTERMLHRCKENTKAFMLAYIFLFSFPGSPSIYYGDEIGLTGNNDPDNRRCMIWDKNRQNLNLLQFFKKMISIRKTNQDLHDVDINWLLYDNNIIIYKKVDTIVIMNNNHETLKVNLPNEITHKQFYDLYNDKNISFENDIELKPFEFFILKYKPEVKYENNN